MVLDLCQYYILSVISFPSLWLSLYTLYNTLSQYYKTHLSFFFFWLIKTHLSSLLSLFSLSILQNVSPLSLNMSHILSLNVTYILSLSMLKLVHLFNFPICKLLNQIGEKFTPFFFPAYIFLLMFIALFSPNFFFIEFFSNIFIILGLIYYILWWHNNRAWCSIGYQSYTFENYQQKSYIFILKFAYAVLFIFYPNGVFISYYNMMFNNLHVYHIKNKNVNYLDTVTKLSIIYWSMNQS